MFRMDEFWSLIKQPHALHYPAYVSREKGSYKPIVLAGEQAQKQEKGLT